METLEYIQRSIASLRGLTGATMTGLTDELANWAPPGMSNSIAVTLLHTIGGEDTFIQAWAQQKPRLWESQGWSERVGLAILPGDEGDGWESARGKTLPLAAILEYQEAVCGATSAYLASLSAEDLDAKMILLGGEHPRADMFILLVSHISAHLGEIAALKGVQGVPGMPY